MRVSALMVSRGSAERKRLAEVSIRTFLCQTVQDCELVIINDGVPFFEGKAMDRVREIRVPFSPANTLGDLRNIGISNARGGLIIQWDDDDWHHPGRIEAQLRYWRPGAAVLLRRQYRYNMLTGAALIFDAPSGIHGTILHERRAGLKYPSLRKEEDTVFLKQFSDRITVNAPAGLYVRFYHGGNTWDEAHIMGQRTLVPHWFQPVTASADRSFLRELLIRYYPWVLR